MTRPVDRDLSDPPVLEGLTLEEIGLEMSAYGAARNAAHRTATKINRDRAAQGLPELSKAEVDAIAHVAGKVAGSVVMATAAKQPNGAGETPHDRGPPIGERSDAQLVLINAADIEPVSVSWLWRNALQCGAFNLIAGQSTAGKSTIALSFSATVTSGNVWPDGQSAGDPARVVFWSGEDGVKDTLLPRFLAAGGERSMMHFIEGVRDGGRKRPFDPSIDMPKLTQAVHRLKDVRLIVLDPIAVAVKGDSHKNVETRVGLQPFADLCMQTGACGLGVHHFTKNTAGGNPLDRVSGSLAFHALPRCVLVAARDQNGGRDARRVLMRAKVSNGPDWGGFDYKLEQRPLDDHPAIEAQRVLWGDAVEGSAREVLARFEAKPPASGTRATIFLTEALKNGPQMAGELIGAAAKAGIPERTLRRAYNGLGGKSDRVGYQGTVIWELPKEVLQ